MRIHTLLMVLAAPAGILLGLHEVGGNPISKGSDTGFAWQAKPTAGQIVLSAEPGGTISCWIKLEVPTTTSKVTAYTETTPLSVKVTQAGDNREWLEITKSGTEDFFDWRSGRTVVIQFDPKPAQLSVEDWEAYLTAKGSDSQTWAQWREAIFIISLVLLLLAVIGAILEAIEKYGAKHVEYTSQKCVEQMIDGFEGKNEEQSEKNRKFLRKFLLEDENLQGALAALNLNPREQLALLFRIREPFHFKIESHIEHLSRLSKRLSRLR
jgi:hypothetical protein